MSDYVINGRVDYHCYLASRDWALKKEAVKERSGGICERCHYGSHENTHHLSYEHLGDEPLEELLGVCRSCHEFLSAKRDDDPAAWLTTLPFEAQELSTQVDFGRSVTICPFCRTDSVRFIRQTVAGATQNSDLYIQLIFKCANEHDFMLAFIVKSDFCSFVWDIAT